MLGLGPATAIGTGGFKGDCGSPGFGEIVAAPLFSVFE